MSKNNTYDFMNNDFEDFYKSIVDNLYIIQNIKVDEKIGFNQNDECYIDMYTYYQGISRWWYDNNRHKSFIFIEQHLNKILDLYNYLSNQKLIVYKPKAKSINKRKYDKIHKYLIDIRGQLDKCISGLYNLKYTYNNDLIYCKRMDDLIAKMNTTNNIVVIM